MSLQKVPDVIVDSRKGATISALILPYRQMLT